MKFFGRRSADRSAAVPEVAVLGAMRCGTNVLRNLLERHWRVRAGFSAYGWKHAGVPVLSPGSLLAYPGVPIVYVVKNPYAFVVSLYRYRLLGAGGQRISIDGETEFDAFLRRPVTIFDSQLRGSPELRFANPLHYWNFVYWNLERLDPELCPSLGLNYEDLIADPETAAQVEALVPMERRSTGPLRLPEAAEKRQAGDARAKTPAQPGAAFDVAYYADRRYVEAFSPAQLRIVAEEADPWIMARRGYEII